VSFSSTEAGLVDVVMPQMGVSVSEGTIVEWTKQVGDWVEYEEPICLISTDKIDTDVPSPAAGRLAEIVVDVGTTVEVGVVLARIATDAKPGEAHASEAGGDGGDGLGTRPPTSEAAAATGATPAGATATPSPEPGTAAPADAPAQGDQERAAPAREAAGRPEGGRRGYSPVVQRMAAEHDIDLSQVRGTGRGGRVRKQDVLAYLEGDGGRAAAAPVAPPEPPLHTESPYRPEPQAQPAPEPAAAPPPPAPEPMARPPAPPPAPAPAPAAAGAYQPPVSAPLSRMRRSIGEHMKRSLDTAATCTTWIEVDMGAVERARKAAGLTALPYVARATIEALREFPNLNAWLQGEDHTVHQEVNLGIAVSLGEDGLIVPVIRSAQDLSVEGLARRIRDLAGAARSRTLQADDVQGGTFTITNPGQYGSIMATPVINQPQVAILDVEATVKRPVVLTADDGTDSIAIRPICVLGLSWDHRALDGALAAQFLAALRRRLEAP
jgi:pyruvate/2-oxoglutarate dehydrogenase complex dihydrolipoamide acyltransferase (E2) component